MRAPNAILVSVCALYFSACTPKPLGLTPPSAAPAAAPGEQEVLAGATRAEQYLEKVIELGRQRAKKLKRAAGTATLIAKVAQYAGGAATVLFGANEEETGTIVSGLVVGGGTLVETLVNVGKKNEEAGACEALGKLDVSLKSEIAGWRTQAKKPEFQTTFPATEQVLYTKISVVRQDCNI